MKSFSELTSASQVNNGDLLAISQTSGSGYASKKTTVKDITDKSNLNLAEEYDSTSSYAVDDYVIYESVLYKCIATTTGAFDSTKWTSVVVTDEMGSGGGGTGGHTIIDENGNSMTARAGLQFVGGANVSDDATNNKTIVDLASAGGIDGVFIDTGNVIQSATAIPNGTSTYTATEDCIVAYQLVATESGCNIQIDNCIIDGLLTGSNYNVVSGSAYLKKGQVIKFVQTSTDAGTYTVYGIQTGTTHSKFQPVIYSTEEREVGVWIDGRPLYQITVDKSASPVSLPNGSWVNIADCPSDAIVIGGEVKSGNLIIDAAEIAVGGGKWQVQRVASNGSDSRSLTYLTVLYIKSSDTAGSGSWTPQGVPAVHYSTDERVIGTWMGETLYEKILTGLNIPVANDWSSVFGDNLNIKFLVNAILYDTQVSANPIIVNVMDRQVLNGGIRINNAQSTSRVITMAVLQYTKSS